MEARLSQTIQEASPQVLALALVMFPDDSLGTGRERKRLQLPSTSSPFLES